jgi:hypothetical protein
MYHENDNEMKISNNVAMKMKMKCICEMSSIQNMASIMNVSMQSMK